jgi:beta-N-acetylhexosaminidase
MVSHEMIPAVDPNLPTSLSPAVITATLRDELGFDGVVISDDLHMKALVARWSIAEASVLAIKAGTDIVADLATPEEVQSTVAALNQAISSGQITRAQINASVQRILTLKIRMGLIPLPGPTHPRPRRPLPDGPTGAQAMLVPLRATSLAAAA